MAFLEPVKPLRCTTRPVEPVNDTNKDVCGVKLYPTAVLVNPVDCDCLYCLLNTQRCFLCLNGSLGPSSVSHSPPPPHAPLPHAHPLIRAIHDITVAVKKAAQNPAVLAS